MVTWGNPTFGGDSSKVQEELRDVVQIRGSRYAFAALRSGGSVITWGDERRGGDSSLVQEQLKKVKQRPGGSTSVVVLCIICM